MRNLILAVSAALAVTGCGSTQSAAPAPIPTATPASATASTTVVPAGGTIVFPSAGGYGGTFVYSANDATAPVPVSLVVSTHPVSTFTTQTVPGTPLASYEFTMAQSVTFQDWHGLLTTMTVPSGIVKSGRTFDEYGFDLTTNTAIGFNQGKASGTTIDFTLDNGSVNLQNHTFLLVLTAFN